MTILISLVILVVSIIFHEVAHGYVAYKFGDPTSKNLGRITLNPIPHIDPIGSLLLPGLMIVTNSPILFGWAKPVPINTRYFKNPIRDMMWVAIAGPLTNISLAIVASTLYNILPLQGIQHSYGLYLTASILVSCVQINLILAIFNLFPIPKIFN